MEERAAEAAGTDLTSAVITGRRAWRSGRGWAGCGTWKVSTSAWPGRVARAGQARGCGSDGHVGDRRWRGGFLGGCWEPLNSRSTAGRLHWRGQRTESLMQFLAAHRHRSVPRDELIRGVADTTRTAGGTGCTRPSMNCVVPACHRPRPSPSSAVTADTGRRWRAHVGRRRGIRRPRIGRVALLAAGSPTRRSSSASRRCGCTGAIPGQVTARTGPRPNATGCRPLRAAQHPCGRPARQARGSCRGAGRG